jgi:hypothetical protein
MMRAAPGKPHKRRSIEVLFSFSGCLPGRCAVYVFTYLASQNQEVTGSKGNGGAERQAAATA